MTFQLRSIAPFFIEQLNVVPAVYMASNYLSAFLHLRSFTGIDMPQNKQFLRLHAFFFTK